MTQYTPRRFSVWTLVAGLLRAAAALLRLWPLWLVVAFVVSPITPYLRWSYTYTPRGEYRIYHRCTYWGKGGMRDVPTDGRCPLFIWMYEQR